MAKFCLECFKKIFGDKVKNDEEIRLSYYKDICEGCNEFKPIVTKIVKKENKK